MKTEETVDFHIRWAWHSISRLYNQIGTEHGLTTSVGYVLLTIEKEGTPSTKLGPMMGMEARSLTRTLRSMEEAGLIKRRPDKADKRLVRIVLTKEGVRKRDIAKKAVVQLNSSIQEEISKQDMEHFFRTMKKMNEIIDNQTKA